MSATARISLPFRLQFVFERTCLLPVEYAQKCCKSPSELQAFALQLLKRMQREMVDMVCSQSVVYFRIHSAQSESKILENIILLSPYNLNDFVILYGVLHKPLRPCSQSLRHQFLARESSGSVLVLQPLSSPLFYIGLLESKSFWKSFQIFMTYFVSTFCDVNPTTSDFQSDQ